MPDPCRPRSLDAVTLTVWLAIQVGAIGVCEAGWRWTARWPDDPKAAAVIVLTMVQMVGLMLMFPRLAASLWTSLVAVAAAIPMAAVAAQLAGLSWSTATVGIAHLTAWLVVLSPWARLTNSHNAQPLVLAVGGLVAIGLPLAAYLAAEFGDRPALASQILRWTPVGIDNRLHFPPPPTFCVFLGVMCGIGYCLLRLTSRRS